ncbi:general secretion pathway protein D [Hydrogenobacter thermophilus TK-6]|uniref:General secretion pathway protein D n=1 Tax=Hydrogenobacter thermophilus (strain DSM 6534 / IAM 12695 / TK-6) TaxID=608538 RepID=D3DIT1_HYDTT|nr:type II secretion system secretin GspD [Hydrogenobacter thermophilus]ADO45660.1 general secretion pathway protein D [Hydrogenobacter thermophilus TK-6]BAI69733.1 general secretion pathway protein D [Hydrogenobacter thermophilus TK-6]
MLRLFILVFSLFVLSVGVYAQTAEELQKQAQEQKKTGKVYLNFQNADISAIAKFMSELTGKNIVLDPNVKGSLTISSAKPVSIREAWDLFVLSLSMQGYGVIEERGFVRIVPLGQATSFASLKRPSTSGEVIIYLYKAENTQALQLQQAVQPFLSPFAKLAIHQQSNTLLIADIAKNIEKVKAILRELDSPERAIKVKVYRLERAKADTVFQSLQPLTAAFQQQLGSPTFITFNKDSNAIIVAANESVQNIVKEVIGTLDRESLGGLERNFYIISLKFVSAEEIYKSLQSLFRGISPVGAVQPQEPYPSTAPQMPEIRGLETPLRREERPKQTQLQLMPIETKEGMRIGFDRGTNSVILYATPQEYEGVKSLIEKMDVRRKQVLLAATVVEMSTSKALDIGVKWQIIGTQGGVSLGGGSLQDVYNAILSGNFIMGVLSTAGRTVTIGGTQLFFPDLLLLFSLLESGSGFNIVSNPKVLTLDNQTAEIKVGQVVPYASGVKFDINGMPVITYDYKEVGLDLGVTPTISGKDLRLQINLKLQDIVDYIRPQIGTLSYAVPVTSNRQVNSDVVVENGQTIIIGGLVNTKTLTSTQGVPGLKDIPGLGRIFRRDTKTEDKVSLFIFLTPYVIEKPEELSEITRQHQKMAEELKKLIEEREKKGNEKKQP